jgi:hypothetical protein
MITTNFYLKDFKTRTGNQVYARLYDTNFPVANIRIGSKVRVFENCWNQEDQIALSSKVYTKDEVNKINSDLKQFRDSINKIIHTLELRNEIVTASKVKDLYETGLAGLKREVERENRVNGFISDYYAPFAAKYDIRSGQHLSYKSFLAYEAATGRKRVKEICYDFMKDYANWLKKDNGNMDSTIHQRITKFQSFVRSELNNSMKIDPTFDDFKVSYEESEIFRLTLEQFNALFLLKCLPVHLQKTLDIFLLMICVGGNRISSALEWSDSSFNKAGRKVTYLEMKKESGKPSKKSVTNPLNEYAIDILDKYGWKIPPVIQSQHFNNQLREIITKSPLKDDFFIIDQDGKKNVHIFVRDEITSKVARKTFVSMNEDFGVSRVVSNSMSNHSTKSGEASDRYRDSTPQAKWNAKVEAMEKWNIEYYKLFPDKATKASGRQVFKLADGKKLVMINNRLVAIE